MNLRWVADLVSGRLPLPVAFWHYGIVYGLIVNLLALLAAGILFAADAPDWLAATAYFSPVPYNVAVLVGVWKSAGAWRGERRWADLARLIIVLWVTITTLV